jgi:integral membrane sensor domain MASE1
MPDEPRDRFPALPTLAVALLYWAAGKLGLLAAIPPGFATPVWLASGVALAGILLFGPRVGLGVFIGSILINLETCLSSKHSGQNNVLTVLGIASGSTLQALAGMWVTRRFLSPSASMGKASSFLILIIFACFGCCAISPSTGVASLWLAGRIEHAQILSQWGTWWVGDTLGVLFLRPSSLAS